MDVPSATAVVMLPFAGSVVGRSWMKPMSIRFAPTASAMRMPSPVMAGLFVVLTSGPSLPPHWVSYFMRISGFAPKPPVVRITPLEAEAVTFSPFGPVASTPTTRPSLTMSFSAFV